MTEYTIGEAAQILQVTTRTLRHWDQIGLLVPTYRTWAEHRLYTSSDLDVALRILVYREAGVPLKDIAELIDGGGSAAEQLRRQREVLVARIGDLHRMVRAVDSLLKGGETMTMNEKVRIFGDKFPTYEAEAEERWGHTDDWARSQEVQKDMTAEDLERIRQEHDAFVARLAEAAEAGVKPGSEASTELVAEHRASMERFYEASLEKQVLLGLMPGRRCGRR